MARTTKGTCKAIMQALRGRGLEYGCSRHELLTAIVDVAGSTKETRDKYMTEMKRHRFIKQVDGGNFSLNFVTVDEDDEMNLIGDLTIRVEMLEKGLEELAAYVRSDQHGS
jgi:hypothetical protein